MDIDGGGVGRLVLYRKVVFIVLRILVKCLGVSEDPFVVVLIATQHLTSRVTFALEFGTIAVGQQHLVVTMFDWTHRYEAWLD